jgi:kinesin family member C1
MLSLPSIPPFLKSNQGHSTLPYKKSRALHLMHSLKTLHPVNSMREHSMRDVSVSTAMSMLQIGEEPRKRQLKEHQAISNKLRPPSTPVSCHRASISTGRRNFKMDGTENALVLFQAPGDSLVAPRTPSQIPVLSKSEAVTTTPATPSRTPRTCPLKAPFLSKDSNITGFTAWDVQGRIEDMEFMYEQLIDKFSGTNAERNSLEEAIGLYKARSKVTSRCCWKYVLI